MEFSKQEKTEEIKQLLELFQKNSDEMLKELKKGADIIIRKNDKNFMIYSSIIRRLRK